MSSPRAESAAPLPETSADSRWQKRRLFLKLARAAVAALVLVLLFRRVEFASVARAIASAGAFLPLAAAGIAFLSQTVAAARLEKLTDAEGMGLSLPALLDVNLATRFYSYLLPAGNVAGVAIRFFRLTDRDTAHTRVVSALVSDRVLATMALCVVGIASWLADTPPGGLVPVAAMAAVLLGLLVAVAALAAPSPASLPGLLGRGRTGRLVRRLDALRVAVSPAGSLGGTRLVEVAALSVLAQFLGIAACVVVASALGLNLPVTTIAWTRSAALLAAALPVSVAGLGLREGVFVYLLGLYGVGTDTALAYSLLVFASVNLSMVLLGGLFESRRLFR